MTYQLALSYLASLNESRIKPGLERIKEGLQVLGSPQLTFPHILVGGTNGKGSVASFMGSALSKAGYRTGIFTSPHLNSFEERIVIGNNPITADDLRSLVKTIRKTGIELTYFEFATVMALVYFADRGVDLAILEVGLGGSWDATNATDPLLSVITSVDLDHEEWLGSTVEEVALEKTGIMRHGKPVVAGSMGMDARKVILRQGEEIGATVVLYGRDYSCKRESTGVSLHFEGVKWNINSLVPGMKGGVQLDNAACALAALETLALNGFEISKEEAISGIRSARWPGRFHVVKGHPALIVDAAHNRAAVKALVESLGGRKHVVWLFSALSGKDIRGMADEMIRLGIRFVLVPLDHPRAITTMEIEKELPENVHVTRMSSVKQALVESRRLAGETGHVVVAGSVVLAGEVLKVLGEDQFGV